MGEGSPDLAELIRDELSRPAPEAVRRLAEAIRERVGPATAAIVFYGSCLREQTAEGVLDFYVLVDDYASASSSRALAWAGAALPPNVFYIEAAGDEETLRCKYALVSTRDFARGAAGSGWRTGIWARFCQPVLTAYARDDAAREALVDACTQSVLSALRNIAPLLREATTSRAFWQAVFRETYAAEMRTESLETIRSLYRAAPQRYDQALESGLAELEQRGVLAVSWQGARFALERPAGAQRRAQRAWRWRRPVRKLVYAAQLVKTAFTFGDWLPYALWKLERHSGSHIEYSERQRRHPFVYGWPLLLRVLWSRSLR